MESNLTIPRATPLDEDQYYCVAMTEGGYAFSNNVTLTVNGENNNVLTLLYFAWVRSKVGVYFYFHVVHLKCGAVLCLPKCAVLRLI